MSQTIGFEKLIAYFHLEGFENSSALIRLAKLFKITSNQLAQIVIAILLCVLLLITRMYVDKLALFAIGILYPGYKSLKLVENVYSLKRNGGMWLSYWSCYAVYSSLHWIVDLVFQGLPLLFVLEAGFLIWLYHERTKGADLANLYVFMPLVREFNYLVNQFKSKFKKNKTQLKED